MILTGPEIHREVLGGRIHIDDYDPSRLEPNSYGFRLAKEILWYRDDVLDCYESPSVCRVEMGSEGMVLEPRRFYLGGTMEAMGAADYVGTLYACRSVATLGMWIQFSAPLGHSGAVFPWTLEIQVAAPLRVFPGMIIGKLAFWTMQGAATRYEGRYTNSTSAVASLLTLDTPRPAVPELVKT